MDVELAEEGALVVLFGGEVSRGFEELLEVDGPILQRLVEVVLHVFDGEVFGVAGERSAENGVGGLGDRVVVDLAVHSFRLPRGDDALHAFDLCCELLRSGFALRARLLRLFQFVFDEGVLIIPLVEGVRCDLTQGALRAVHLVVDGDELGGSDLQELVELVVHLI